MASGASLGSAVIKEKGGAVIATGQKSVDRGAISQRRARNGWLDTGPWVCLLVTLAVCLAHNLVRHDLMPNLVFDAAHYIDSARDLHALLGQGLGRQVGAPSMRDVGAELLLDGPVLPAAGALALALAGKAAGGGDPTIFVFLQCFLQAVAAALTCILARCLTGSRAWGLLAGLAWGLYPAAVIGAGYFMSETLACVQLLAMAVAACLLVSTGEQAGSPRFLTCATACGALTGLVILTKPVLALACAWAGLVALTLVQSRRGKLLLVLAGMLGCAVTLTPWTIFTKDLTGHAYLAPRRLPTHNVVMGFDIETDGVGAKGAALDRLFGDADGPLAAATGLVKAHPLAVTNLLLRKPERIWALPWNDLRRSFFFLPAAWLVWWHQALVLAGVVGGAAVICRANSADPENRLQAAVGWTAAGIVLCHLAYIFFESIPRYGFTSMPFLVLLAIYLLRQIIVAGAPARRLALLLVAFLLLTAVQLDPVPYLLPVAGSFAAAAYLGAAFQCLLFVAGTVLAFRVVPEPGQRKVPRRVCMLVLSVLGVAAIAAHAWNPNAVREWSCRLTAGRAACRQLSLRALPALPSGEAPLWAAVLIDTDRKGGEAEVSVNGRRLGERPISIYRFDAAICGALPNLQELAALLNKPLESIRQWRVASLPVSWLDLNGDNLISVTAVPGGRPSIYGDYPPLVGRRRVLSLAGFSPAKIWNSVFSLEGRTVDPVPAPIVKARCWLAESGRADDSDLSASAGRQSGQYRIYLVLGYRASGSKTGEPARKSQGGRGSAALSTGVPLASFDPPLASPAGRPGSAMTGAPAERWHRCRVRLGRLEEAGTHLSIRLGGRIRCSRPNALASVALLLHGAPGSRPVVMPGGLRHLSPATSWTSFSIVEEVPAPWLKDGLSAAELEVYCRQDVQFDALRLQVKPLRRPQLTAAGVLIL
jgi:hypothetical protein